MANQTLGWWETGMETQDADWQSIVGDQDWDSYCGFTSQERQTKIAQLQHILETHSSHPQQAEIWRQIGRLWSAEGSCVSDIEAHQNALASFDQAIALQPEFPEAWNNRGNSLVDLDRREEAIAAFDTALQLKPDYYAAWVNQASAFYNFTRYEEAIASYDRALQLKPDAYEIWRDRGFALNQLGRYEEAIASFDRALRHNPDTYTWSNRGTSLINLGRWEEAIASYDQVLKDNPSDPQAWSYRGAALINLRRNKEALASFDQALQHQSNDPQIWSYRRAALINLGRYEEAVASLDQVLQYKPDDLQALNNRSLALKTLGRYEELIANCDQVLQYQPEDTLAWSNRGEAQIKLGRYEDAIVSYDRVLQRQSDNAKAWYYHGFALNSLGRYEEAIVSFDQALHHKPDDVEAWIDRGVALMNLNRDEEAIASYGQALHYQPNLPPVWYCRATVLGKQQRYEEAIASCDQALNYQPDFAQAWYLRGEALRGLKRYEEAIPSFDRALNYQPDYPEAWRERGDALNALNRCEEAIASFDQVLRIKPNFPRIWSSRGAALNNCGRYQEALESAEQGITLQPGEAQGWYVKGYALNRLTRYEGAIASYDQALQYNPKLSSAWHGRGVALANLQRYEEAISSYDHALSIDPTLDDTWISRGLAALNPALHNLGYGWSNPTLVVDSLPPELQNPDLDLRGYEGCLACIQEGFKHTLEDSEAWGRLHKWLGEAHRLWGNHQESPFPYWQKAIDCYESALNIFTAATFPQARLEVLALLIRTYRALRSNDEMVARLRREGAALLRGLLQTAVSDAQKQRLGLQFASFEQATVDLFVQQGEPITALETAEKDKNWLMTWLLRWQDQNEIATASYTAMRQLLRPDTAIVYWHYSPDALTTFILRQDSPQPIVISRAQDDSKAGIDQVNQLERWLQDWNHAYAQVTRKDKAQPGESLPKDTPSDDIPAPTWRDKLPTVLANLAELLDIAQVNAHLGDCSRLILVPHRDLHRLPLAALFPDHPPRVITRLPSLQVGLSLRPSPPLHLPTATGLSIEAPYHQGLDRLSDADMESYLLRRLMPQLTALPGDQADRTTVHRAMTQPHQVIHFNGHAFYNITQPNQSALALEGEDRLTVAEIYALAPPLHQCQLVSLASCETAITGNQTITSEYIGITSAFLSHQIPHVLSTLWTVESEATALFILQFYHQIGQGLAIPQAFQHSQTWLRTVTVNTLIADHDRWLQELPAEGDRLLRRFLRGKVENLRIMERTIGSDHCPYAHPAYWAAYTLTGYPISQTH